MADADGKMRMETKNADNKKGKKKKTRKADGTKKQQINKQTNNYGKKSFFQVSHGWTLHLHTEGDANSWQFRTL